ncbi:MAG: hypothetical protein AUK47_18885 [Deltaproteobacteria bacterium CG2_30_63_29]|nr:MAG: hypothetical protein AUK47_18885 [Deltaproteobacteria bacterium CG2_30_63_29]PJB34672.1 MAG: hypothetical protein CO108_27770 [Deltaproteobacteria bacterium CG_4_9_14_3_um_filter_63_12]
MKEYQAEKDASFLQIPNLLEQKENKEKSKPGGADYQQGAKLGDAKAQRAIDRAGPAVAQDLQDVEQEKNKAGEVKKTDETLQAQTETTKKETEGENVAQTEQQTEEERKKKEQNTNIEYDEEKVAVPSLFGIKLAVLCHPAFAHQGKHIARNGGDDAFILLYWAVIQHHKFESQTAVSDFRNAITQRAKQDRITKAAQWVAQADASEYSAREVVEYLTNKRDTLPNAWQKPGVDRGNDIETDLAMTEYKDWGRVSAQSMGYFPFVDFIQDGVAVSLKTVDPKDAKAVERLKAHIDELASRQPMQDGKPLKLVVDIRVPDGEQGKVEELIAYGVAQKVEVKVHGA